MNFPTPEEQPQRWSTGGLSRTVYILTETGRFPFFYKTSWGRIVQATSTPSGELELALQGSKINGTQKVLVPSDKRDDLLRGFNTRDDKALEGKDLPAYTINGKLYGCCVVVSEPMIGSMN